MSQTNNEEKPIESTALFACPFCGQDAIIEHSELEIECGIKAHAECSNPKCRAFGPDAETAALAAARWNLRNSPWCDACKEPDCKISGDGTCEMIRKYLANA
jgi:hypothetical protein